MMRRGDKGGVIRRYHLLRLNRPSTGNDSECMRLTYDTVKVASQRDKLNRVCVCVCVCMCVCVCECECECV